MKCFAQGLASGVLKRRPSRTRRTTLCLALLAAFSLQAQAQSTYPNKPVRMIVSYAAGNVTDTLARVVAQRLSDKWRQPVTIDNRPGQGGSLGAQIAVKAPADGYTLLFSAMAAMAINPHVYANLGYDVRKDFAPVVNVACPTMVLVANPELKINSLTALIAYSKANPTALNYGTAGNGTVPHLNMETLKAQTGLMAQHVPYKAAGAVLTDVLGGRIQIQQEALSVLLPHIKAKKLLPIAAGSSKRLAQLPDVPTIIELFPKYQAVVPWLGILAPAGTPKAIVDKINKDVDDILRQPDVQEKLQSNGLDIVGGAPETFAKTITTDYDRMDKLVKQLGLKVD